MAASTRIKMKSFLTSAVDLGTGIQGRVYPPRDQATRAVRLRTVAIILDLPAGFLVVDDMVYSSTHSRSALSSSPSSAFKGLDISERKSGPRDRPRQATATGGREAEREGNEERRAERRGLRSRIKSCGCAVTAESRHHCRKQDCFSSILAHPSASSALYCIGAVIGSRGIPHELWLG